MADVVRKHVAPLLPECNPGGFCSFLFHVCPFDGLSLGDFVEALHIQAGDLKRSPRCCCCFVLCSAPPLLSFVFRCSFCWVCSLRRCRLHSLSKFGKCYSACVVVGQILLLPAGSGLPGQGVPSVVTVQCSAPGCGGSSSELCFFDAPKSPVGVSPSLACWVVLCGVRGSGLSPPLG